MTCGEGGAITTNDEDLAEKIRRMSSLGYAAVKAGAGKSMITREMIQDPAYLRHASIGWNYRLSELSCAVLLGQVERLDELVGIRLDSANALAAAVGKCSWLIPQKTPAGFVHSYWALHLPARFGRSMHLARIPQEVSGERRRSVLRGLGAELPRTRFPQPENGRLADPEIRDGPLPGGRTDFSRRLLQFKTNYFDAGRRAKAAEAMARTVAFFSRG